MTRRWTPRRFVTLRRVRVMACVASLTLTSALAFGVGARKSVALTVNGETTTVTTYAMSVDRLLQEQGVKVKTHDLVESTSPTSMLKNHDVVNVQSAYQTTITIDGQEVPFWTVASSAEQLLDFFNQNETEAAKITVNISNVYNKLTGGLIINQKGPVTVIADGKSSVAPNGKLPAASILDAKGITLGKEDRVSVEKDGKKTILRVRRVTHGEETRTKEVPVRHADHHRPEPAAGRSHDTAGRRKRRNPADVRRHLRGWREGKRDADRREDHENRHRQSHCGRTGKNYGRYRQVRQIRQQRQRQQQRR